MAFAPVSDGERDAGLTRASIAWTAGEVPLGHNLAERLTSWYEANGAAKAAA